MIASSESPQFQSPISYDSTVGGVNLGVASLTSTSITHKLTFNPASGTSHQGEFSIYLPERLTVHHRAGVFFFFFFPDSSLPVAHGFECWRSKLRKTELHLIKTQEVKNKQNHDTLDKPKGGSICWFCILPHKQTWKTGFLSFCRQTTTEHSFRKYMPLKNITSSLLQ